MLQLLEGSRLRTTNASALPERGWIHAVAPDEAEQAALIALGVPDWFLTHALDADELPRVDHDHAGNHLVLLQVPCAGRRRPIALGVVLRGDLAVTIAGHELAVTEDLATRPGAELDSPVRVLLQLVLAAADAFLDRVREIDGDVEKLETRLQRSLRNEEVIGLLESQKLLVLQQRALGADLLVLERLRKEEHGPIGAQDHELLEDALVELHQAVQMTNISSEILSNMMDAFTSIISNNLASVLKVMTALTIMLSIPAVISGLWGMNVPVPGAGGAWAFVALCGSSVLITLAIALVFVKKRWL